MKSALFWLGAFSYFIGDVITTAIGLHVGAVELNPLIKSLPYMVLAKVIVLIFLFSVLKYFEHVKRISNDAYVSMIGNTMETTIVCILVFLGLGIGIINNLYVILTQV